MAKSFKKLISEVAQPKAGEEKAFKDQHTVQKFDAQPTGQDHIFKGTIDTKKRLADMRKGEDEAKYDAAYSKKADTFQLPRDIDESVLLDESPVEEKEMMLGQLRAMSHYIMGIANYIRKCDDCEEWYQNKLAGVAKEMSTLYGYATSETHAMMGEALNQLADTYNEGTVNSVAKSAPSGDKKAKSYPDAPASQKASIGKNAGKTGVKAQGGLNVSVRSSVKEETDLDEAHQEWHVTFKTGHKPQRVKGRNTAEAIKKAERRAQKSGEKDPRQLAMYKNIKKVSEEAEQIDEISKDLAGRYLKKAPARAADAGEKIARASQAYDRKSGDAQRKKGIRTFLNVHKGVERATNRLMRNEEADLEEAKKGKPLTSKQMRRALATAKAAPKDKVSLKKAPFDIPKEEAELEEKFTIRTSILSLDSGEKVKVSRQDAELLTKFFRDLNTKNSNEMRKVLVKDKAGYEEILSFAREAL